VILSINEAYSDDDLEQTAHGFERVAEQAFMVGDTAFNDLILARDL